MNLRSNLCLIALCLAFLGIAEAAVLTQYTGMMQVAKKSVIAKDMLYILKTIFQNAKFWDYPDIKDEEGSGVFLKGMFITDIDVIGIEFNHKALINKLNSSDTDKKIWIASTDPVLKYTFTFKWKAEAFGVKLAYGKGNATMTSKAIQAIYALEGKPSDLIANFAVEIISITGMTTFAPNIKEWILKKMTEVVYPALQKGIYYNTHFIHEHMHVAMQKITKQLNNKHYLHYFSKPLSLLTYNDFLVFGFSTDLKINEKVQYAVNRVMKVEEIDTNHDVALYINPKIAALSYDIYGAFDKYNGAFDMKKLGLNNEVRDFFEAIPTLADKYSGNEVVIMSCAYANLKYREDFDGVLIFPVKCTFTVESDNAEILATQMHISMKYNPYVTADSNQLFVTQFTNAAIFDFDSKPTSKSINEFLASLTSKFSQARFEGHVADVPMIRYEPYRDYKSFFATVKADSYIAYYNDTTD